MCLFQLTVSGTKILHTDTLSGNIDYLIISMFQNTGPSAGAKKRAAVGRTNILLKTYTVPSAESFLSEYR